MLKKTKSLKKHTHFQKCALCSNYRAYYKAKKACIITKLAFFLYWVYIAVVVKLRVMVRYLNFQNDQVIQSFVAWRLCLLGLGSDFVIPSGVGVISTLV